MEQDRMKWNGRYEGETFFLGPHPSRFLAEHIQFVETLMVGRRALDLACGEGRNSIFLAKRGFEVTGIDIAEEGLAKAARWAAEEKVSLTLLREDLETFRLSGSWDLILNFNFLLRSLIPQMVEHVDPGGVILFDTILDAPSIQGLHRKEFLLQPGELSALFAPFPGAILHYEERPNDISPTARLIFQKGCNTQKSR